MLTTNSKQTYDKVKKIIAHGINKNKKKYFWHREADLPGHNYRLPNHLAALGISQLKKISSVITLKEKIMFKKPTIFSKPIARIEKGRLLIMVMVI